MTDDGGQMTEDRSRTRRRPIGRDYAAAKDAECGSRNAAFDKLRRGKVGKKESGKAEKKEGGKVRW
jgi:hypothetical protein